MCSEWYEYSIFISSTFSAKSLPCAFTLKPLMLRKQRNEFHTLSRTNSCYLYKKMFIYLSKKIAIPNNTRLKCIGWNKDHGYIACGGEEGLLKVLKLDQSGGKDGKIKGLAAPSNLSMNQTLEGHSGQIQVVEWNEANQKLTSSDQYGLIIVWMMYKGSWYEEMINNRNKSVVRGMDWNSDGSKICIVYEDGAVIVGSVDGNRIWGKELKVMLGGVCWSPDSRLLLFSMSSGEIHVYDNTGNFVSKMNIQVSGASTSKVVTLNWYNGRKGFVHPLAPTLVICYDSGKIQLMKNETDDSPILIDTGMTTVGCRWSHDGSVLAVAGTMYVLSNTNDGSRAESNVVQFYSPFGEHLRTLKVPGKQITACAWEGGSLRIALSVDSFIYFANIRPDYKWAYFSNTVVYTYPRPDKKDAAVVFWNCKTNEKNYKYVKSVYCISSSGEHCVLAVEQETSQGDSINLLILCNTLGTPVDTKQVQNLDPFFISMTNSHVYAASKDAFIIWQFRTAQTWMTLNFTASEKAESRREKLCLIDDENPGLMDRDINEPFPKTDNPICCLTASEKYLVIGRESGKIQRYILNNVVLTDRYVLSTKPHKLALNCNSSVLSVIDVTGLLKFIDLEGSRIGDDDGNKGDDLAKFERKDVWDMKWALDNPELFAMMEKTRMYIFRNMEPEEPILSAGYICSFKDLEIKAVLLDEILRDPDSPSSDLVLDLEVKSLRDTRDLLEKVGIKDALAFIEENPHPRLWRLLAEAAVEALDLATAEAAYVRCKDYAAIQFIKRLGSIQNETIRKAEVAAWFSDFEKAEKIYLEIDRKDLAVDMRRKLGDWFRVLSLLKSGSSGNDAEMEEAWNSIGDYYSVRHKWNEAAQFYEKGRNTEKLIECYYALEDFDNLENLVDSLQPDDPLLETLGNMFTSVGLGIPAVEAYIKCGRVSRAIDTCVSLNQWHEAVELASKHDQPKRISTLLAKYAEHLLSENKTLQAIELYRKANYFLEAAKLLSNIAQEETFKRSSPLRIKKLYVLSALLVENYLKKNAETGSNKSALLGLLLNSDSSTTGDVSIVDKAWRGAEAYHFLMLAQRQLYVGSVDDAMKTCLHLRQFEDVLNEEDIYSLLALSSCANRAFGTCSRAFIKLESLEDDTAREEYRGLAMDIFTKQSPKDSRSNRAECASCETMIPDWVSTCPSCQIKFSTCIVTGRPLMNLSKVWSCGTCHHQAYEQDITMRHTCPLCHAVIRV